MSIACPLFESSESSLDRVRAERARAKRLASPRRVVANRLNSRRSTGPRTADGKARSSRNALKHGLCAGHGPLPSECGATFSLFLDELEAELRPRTALQRHLFTQIAGLLWNVQRMPQAHRDLFVRESGKAAVDETETIAASEVLARRFSDDPSNGFVLLGRYERSMQNGLLRMIRQFHSLQKSRPTTPYADGDGYCPREGSQPAWTEQKAEEQRKWFDEQIERVHRGLPVEGGEDTRREVERLAAERGQVAREEGPDVGATLVSPGVRCAGDEEGDTSVAPTGRGPGKRSQTKPSENVAGERETRKCPAFSRAPVTKRTHCAAHVEDTDAGDREPMPRAPGDLQSSPAEPPADRGAGAGDGSALDSTEQE